MQLEMQVANQLAAGAAEAITVGDQTFLVGQPTDADFVTLRRQCLAAWKAKNSNPLQVVAESVKGLPPNLAEAAIREAVKLQAGNQEPTDESIKNMLYERETCAFWLWLLAKKHDAGLKLSTVQNVVTTEAVNDILASLLRATRLVDVSPNADGGNG